MTTFSPPSTDHRLKEAEAEFSRIMKILEPMVFNLEGLDGEVLSLQVTLKRMGKTIIEGTPTPPWCVLAIAQGKNFAVPFDQVPHLRYMTKNEAKTIVQGWVTKNAGFLHFQKLSN